MRNQVLDVLGVGLGPFNISLNCLLAKTTLNSVFIDKNNDFNWHLNSVGGNLQVSWLKDCVSAIDPTNPYSFLNYITKNGLFYQFSARKCDSITRLEYNNYLKWVVGHFKNINFDENAENIKVTNDGYYLVSTNKNKYIAKSVVVGTGAVPNIPDFAKKYSSDDVFHSSVYLKYREKLKGKVLIVGNGQSACEIVMDLLNNVQNIDIVWVSERSSFHSLDDNVIINSLYSPAYTKEIRKTHKSYKEKLFGNILYTSDGISSVTANQLFETIYNKKKQLYVSLDTSLYDLTKTDATYRASLMLKKLNENTYLNVNKVILCTGYKQSMPKFLLQSGILNEENQDLLNDDFSCKTKLHAQGKIYIQNFARNIIGPIDSNLSIMPWRNCIIINSILESNFYNNLDLESFAFLNLQDI